MAEAPPTQAPTAARPAIDRHDLATLALLWLGGFDLRVTLLAVPPLIPAIHRDLGLDEKGVSILTGLPVLLLAAAAIPGSLLIARLGARRALIAGLLAIGVGSALRGAGTSLVPLFAMTFVMGAGVAVSQPAFPTLTRGWFPTRVALATAVYSNGLLMGETLPASLTGPVIAPALGGSWQLALAFWSAPAFLAAALFAARRSDIAARPPGRRRWLPDFRNGQMWRLGLVMGFASAAYFGTNAFLPDFVRATGHAGLKDAALTALNASQLAASVGLLALGPRLVSRAVPFAAAGGGIALAAAALALLPPGPWIVLCAGLIGLTSAVALVLTLALPPLLAAEPDVARFSAGIFLIVYASSFAGPLLGGAAWDATGWPPAAFVVLAASGVAMALLAARADLRPRPDRA